MCGIAGFINRFVENFGESTIKEMLSVMIPRGPDGTSWMGINNDSKLIWRDLRNFHNQGNLFLFAMGCSRLAIVDRTDSGLQPICNEDKTIWVVLNGEIYNFIELRQELEGLHHTFSTQTDTEVICHAYEEWGKDCFNHFNGQFAIAIYDINMQKLILSRDRLGVKPLFYHSNSKYFIFASEIKSLLTLPFFEPGLNLKKLARVIGLSYRFHENGKETLFDDILQILPGELIEISSELKISKHQYWSIYNFPVNPELSFRRTKSLAHELILDAVKIRLRGDCLATFILSGGIDSSSITGIASKIFNITPETFSLDLPDPRFNENEEILEIAKYSNYSPSFVKLDEKNIQSLLSTLIGIFDEPIPTPNGILHYNLAQSISKKKYKVLLNGIGGDEVFLGYHEHFLYFLRYLKTTKNKVFSKEFSAWTKNQKRSQSVFSDFCEFLDKNRFRDSPDFLARSNAYNYINCLKPEYKKQYYCPVNIFENGDFSPASKQIMDITRLTLPHALKMDDRFYMSHGIETRHPFLDYRIVEFGLSLPPTMKIRNGFSKFIVRSIAKNYIPSSTRINTRKIGLNLPMDRYMRGFLRSWVLDNLSNHNNPIFEFADYKEVKKICDAHLESKADHYLKLWDLINVNTWLKLFF